MAEDGDSEKPSSEDKKSAPPVKTAPNGGTDSLNGGKMESNNGDKANHNVEKMSTKKDSSVSVVEILKSPHLDDAGKFDVFRGLVEAGKLTNKEVVNSVLHLVRSTFYQSSVKLDYNLVVVTVRVY